MTQIYFKVPAVPVAQPRHRTTKNGHSYAAPTTHAIHSFKASVRMAAADAYQGPPLTGPLGMVVFFVFPREASKCWKTRPTPRYPKATKPDADNLVKSCLDALNKLAFVDDGQVANMVLSKSHAAGDEQPHVEIWINTLDEA